MRIFLVIIAAAFCWLAQASFLYDLDGTINGFHVSSTVIEGEAQHGPASFASDASPEVITSALRKLLNREKADRLAQAFLAEEEQGKQTQVSITRSAPSSRSKELLGNERQEIIVTLPVNCVRVFWRRLHGRLRFVALPNGQLVADTTGIVAPVTSGRTLSHPAQCAVAFQPATGFAGEQPLWYTTAPGGSLEKQRQINEPSGNAGHATPEPFSDETLHAVVLFIRPSSSAPLASDDAYHLSWDGLLPALPFPPALNPSADSLAAASSSSNSSTSSSSGSSSSSSSVVDELLLAQIAAASQGAMKKAQLPWRYLPVLTNDEDKEMAGFGGDETHACSRSGVRALEPYSSFSSSPSSSPSSSSPARSGAWIDVVLATDYVMTSEYLTVDIVVRPPSTTTSADDSSSSMVFRSRCWYPSELLALRRAINDEARREVQEEEEEADTGDQHAKADEEADYEGDLDDDEGDGDDLPASGSTVDYLKRPLHESGGEYAKECGVDGNEVKPAELPATRGRRLSKRRGGAKGGNTNSAADISLWRRRKVPESLEEKKRREEGKAEAVKERFYYYPTARALEQVLVSLPLLPNSLLSRCVAAFEGLPSGAGHRYDVLINVPHQHYQHQSSSFSLASLITTHTLEDVAPSSTVVFRAGTVMGRGSSISTESAAVMPSSPNQLQRQQQHLPPSRSFFHMRRSQLTMKPCKVLSVSAAEENPKEKDAHTEAAFHAVFPVPNPVSTPFPCFLVGGVLSDSDKKFLVNPATGEARVPSLEGKAITRSVLDALCTGGPWAKTNDHNPTNMYLLASDGLRASTLFVNVDSRMLFDRTQLRSNYNLLASSSSGTGKGDKGRTASASVKLSLPKQPRRPATVAASSKSVAAAGKQEVAADAATSSRSSETTATLSLFPVLEEVDARCAGLMMASLAASTSPAAGLKRNLTAASAALLPADCVSFPSPLYRHLKRRGLGGQVTTTALASDEASDERGRAAIGDSSSATQGKGEGAATIKEENVVAIVNVDGSQGPISAAPDLSSQAPFDAIISTARLHNEIAQRLATALYRHYRDKLLAPELGSSFVAATEAQLEGEGRKRKKPASLTLAKAVKAKERIMALLHPSATHPLSSTLLSPWAKRDLGKQALADFAAESLPVHPRGLLQRDSKGLLSNSSLSLFPLRPLLMPLPGLSVDLDMDVILESSSLPLYSSQEAKEAFTLPYVVPSYYPHAFDGSEASLKAFDHLLFESARAIVLARLSPAGSATALQRLFAEHVEAKEAVRATSASGAAGVQA